MNVVRVPVGIPWIESPWWEEELNARGLAPEDADLARRFARDGYVILDLDPAETTARGETIMNALEETLQSTRRVQDAWKTIPEARELAVLPSVMQLLKTLYGREPVPFQTLHFRAGSEQAAHSDALHFHTLPQRFMCGVWIAFEDVDERNGPLFVYPGSHRLPIWELYDFGLPMSPASHKPYEEAIRRTALQFGFAKKILTVKKGQAVIWAANLLHGGESIKDPTRTRKSQVTHVVFEGCAVYTPHRSDLSRGLVHLRNTTDLRTGEPMRQTIDGKPVNVSAEQDFWMQPGLGSFLKAFAERAAVSLKKIRRK